MPLAAGLVALLVLVSTTAVLARPGTPFPDNAATRLLGADGHREFLSQGGGAIVREYAWNSGSQMLSTGPVELSSLVTDLAAFQTTAWVRVLDTVVSGGQVSHRGTAWRLDEAGVSRAIDFDGDSATAYEPAVLLLPHDVRAGSTWAASGTATRYGGAGGPELLAYSSTASAAPANTPALAQEGCLEIIATTIIGSEAETTTERWCPGKGPVTPESERPLPPFTTAPDLGFEPRWQPERWQATTSDLNLSPPMMWGTQLPTLLRDDTLVIAHSLSGDLILAPGAGLAEAFRVHPGGRVVTIRGFGDLIVVTTTTAAVVAYDVAGVWRWEANLPDVVVQPAALTSDGRIVLVDGSGRLTALDAVTGEEVWSRQMSDQPSSPPTACGDRVALATTANDVMIFDAAGGEVGSAGATARVSTLACDESGGLYVVEGAWLQKFDAQGNWLTGVPIVDATVTAVEVTGGVVVTHSDRALSGYDAGTLALRWRLDHRFASFSAHAGVLLALDESRAIALDAAGRVLAEWPTDIAADGLKVPIAADETGVGMLGFGQTLLRLR